MPDENTATVGSETSTESGGENGQSAANEAGTVDEKGATVNQDNAAPANEEVEEDLEPTVRKRMTPKDYIIQRQQEKIAKLKASQTDEQVGDESQEEEFAPEDEELITKVVSKHFAPILQRQAEAEDKQEVTEFLTKNPDFKQFEAKALKYMAHPSRRHLPVQTIFYEVAGDKLMKIGAERERKAQEEARATQSGGGSARGDAGKDNKDVRSMPKADFEALQEQIRRKHY